MSGRALRLGVDIGGTFTDGMLVDEETGEVWSAKVLSTPADPSAGFAEVTARVLNQASATPSEVGYLIHATTVATNAVIERRGARVGAIFTSGFRDVLEIGRQIRHELYNLQTDKPPALIPRRLCREVVERLDHRGEVVSQLDEESVETAVRHLRDEGVEAIAVCLLHSYRNPAHEERVRDVIRRLHPSAFVSLSSEIAPEIREYWRASTTALNAYLEPIVGTYLMRVEERLQEASITAPLFLMQSSGGITRADNAKRRPVYLIESGPAAGVAVAAYYCAQVSATDAIAFDMGGTTAKMGLIRDGDSVVSSEFEVGGHWSGTPLSRGRGYPVLGSVVDLVEVGAGGGSIAWIDEGGALRVGPRSAGAEPGPVCYGRGGSLPTVTDANLVLGRLDADYFAGGEFPLDLAGARDAIELVCARPLGLEAAVAASGIVAVANATMVQAMRLVTIERGYDPTQFALLATGGGGPLHANALALELGIPKVIVPPTPGVASALGMLVSDVRWDVSTTRLEALERIDFGALATVYASMEATALDALASEGIGQIRSTVKPFAEMRYVGQSWKLRLALQPDWLANDPKVELKRLFDALHHQTYGYDVPAEPVEIVNVGVSVTGVIRKPSLRLPEGEVQAGRLRARAKRNVYFAEISDWISCEVVSRYSLAPSARIQGPAVIEEKDSTTLVHPDYEATVLEHGELLLAPSA